MNLSTLPRDCLVLVLARLEPRDVFNLASVNASFREQFEDDELWHCLASELFRSEVDVLRLVGPPRHATNTHPLPIPGSSRRTPTSHTPQNSFRSSSPFAGDGPSISGQSFGPSPSQPHGGRIRNFKEAYVVLSRLSDLRGLWRVIGEGDGSIVSFEWSGEQMVGQQLVFVEGTGRPDYSTFCTIKPSMDVLKSVHWEGSTVGIWTNDDRDANPYTPDRSMTSQASMDAAEVGFGTPRSLSSRDSPIMGASPENSFRQAWSQFMSSSVQARSKMRRRTSRNRFAQLRHLKRVTVPASSKRHPLAGIWVAEIDEGEFEVISVVYDFRSSAAMLLGTKLSGPGFHEHGDGIFRIRAAQHSEYDPGEIELFNRFMEYGNVEIQEDDLGLQSLEIDDSEDRGSPLPVAYCVGRSSYFSVFDEDRDDDGMWPVRLYVLNPNTLGLFFVDDNESLVLRRAKLE